MSRTPTCSSRLQRYSYVTMIPWLLVRVNRLQITIKHYKVSIKEEVCMSTLGLTIDGIAREHNHFWKQISAATKASASAFTYSFLYEQAFNKIVYVGYFMLVVLLFISPRLYIWGEVFLALFLVASILAALAYELDNTAREILCNIIRPQYCERVGIVKDHLSGASLCLQLVVVMFFVLYLYVRLNNVWM